ncbi:TPA: formylglycine-generating enzyme family protein [Streptococcus suis]
MKRIPAGTYLIGGSSQHGFKTDLEDQEVHVTIPEFFMSSTTVTNAEFAKFIEATGYVTDAQKIGYSFVFHLLAEDQSRVDLQVQPFDWWLDVPGADWAHPFGPNSNLDGLLDHPVVHVSHNDAVAYCRWAGHRLPTEAEWEIAAKAGSLNKIFPWGDDSPGPLPSHCNTWQGQFPYQNSLDDGFLGTAPVQTYPPNDYGLYQMIGNVWEWCANPGKIDLRNFKHLDGPGFWANIQGPSNQTFALKGGSFLCHDSYCQRYRIAARNANTAMTSASNIGFRTLKDFKKEEVG